MEWMTREMISIFLMSYTTWLAEWMGVPESTTTKTRQTMITLSAVTALSRLCSTSWEKKPSTFEEAASLSLVPRHRRSARRRPAEK